MQPGVQSLRDSDVKLTRSGSRGSVKRCGFQLCLSGGELGLATGRLAMTHRPVRGHSR